MTPDAISRNLRDWVCAHARGGNAHEITDDALLMKEGRLDSLASMSLISHVEFLLGRDIPDELMSLDNFESMQKIKTVFFGGAAK